VGSTYRRAPVSAAQTFTVTGVPGTVGANIVGSSTPTSLTTTIVVGGGLQGVMFAVRFASIRLNLQLTGAAGGFGGPVRLQHQRDQRRHDAG
jgi:hypothetical protein